MFGWLVNFWARANISVTADGMELLFGRDVGTIEEMLLRSFGDILDFGFRFLGKNVKKIKKL